MSIFGPIVSGHEVEAAVVAHLREWMQTYLAELERIEGREPRSLPMVRSWTTTPTLERWPEDQLPAVLCVSTGLSGRPHFEGDGSTRASWQIGLALICSARTEAETHAFAKTYFAALRTIMLQHPSIGGFAEGTDWEAEDYDALPSGDKRRTLAAAYGLFTVEVSAIANRWAGPTVPPEDPYAPPADWPTVETTDVEVDKS